MKRPRLREDLAARIDLIRGDVSFDRLANRTIEAGLDEGERRAAAVNSELLPKINELRAASRAAGADFADPLD